VKVEGPARLGEPVSHAALRRRFTCLLFGVGVVSWLACADRIEAPICQLLVGDARVIQNIGPGRWERAGITPTFAELWRRGGTNEGEELALPIFPQASLDGRLAIPDFGLGEVVVIEPDGTWRGAWAKQGQGPGEVAIPVAVAWSADETLSVFDIARTSVVRLRDGEPVGEDTRIDPKFVAPILRAGQLSWAGVHPDGTVLLDPGWSASDLADDGTPRASGIVRLGPNAAAVDTVAWSRFPTVSREGGAEWPVPGWPRPVAATGLGGALAWGGADSTYRVIVRAGAGPPLQICRAAEPLPLTAAERGDSVPEGFADLAAAIREAERPPAPAPFGRLILGARGRVWVQRERRPAFPGPPELWGRPGGRYDVFDRDGAYLGEARLPPRATLQAARGDTVWAFEFGDYDETWVVAYRLELARTSRGRARAWPLQPRGRVLPPARALGSLAPRPPPWLSRARDLRERSERPHGSRREQWAVDERDRSDRDLPRHARCPSIVRPAAAWSRSGSSAGEVRAPGPYTGPGLRRARSPRGPPGPGTPGPRATDHARESAGPARPSRRTGRGASPAAWSRRAAWR